MRKIVTISSAVAMTFGLAAPAPAFAVSAESDSAPQAQADSQIRDKSTSIETAVNRIGMIRTKTALIYSEPGAEDAGKPAGEEMLGQSFYIKKQAELDSSTYFLIVAGEEEKEEIGWINQNDIETYTHAILQDPPENTVLYLKENPTIYRNHAWAGEKFAAKDLQTKQGDPFTVRKAEKVGDDIWYGGTLTGESDLVWISAEDLSDEQDIPAQEKKTSSIPEKETAPEQNASDDVPAQNKAQSVKPASETASTLKRSAVTAEAPVVSNTSRLGHIRSTSGKMYKTIGDESTAFKAGTTYTNAVYYIKQQAIYNGQTYYLLSPTPSYKTGIAWMKASDLSTHEHVGVDKEKKTFRLTGKGKGYAKAWGGNKDFVYNLADFKGKEFNVNLTEKVGNNIWYRGTLNGKTVWVHSSYVESQYSQSVEEKTSRLGHIRSASRKIYKTAGDESTAFAAGTKYTNAVYYIKKQAKVDGVTYYLISKNPSYKTGVVGWMKASDLSTHVHTGVDKKKKTGLVKGTLKGYSKAWGGSKDVVYSNLAKYKNQIFNINLTEKVGNNIWYRGTLNGQTVWIHSSGVSEVQQTSSSAAEKAIKRTYTDYNATLDKMVDIQMKVNPQTDKRYQLWISGEAFGSTIKDGKGTVQATYNIRRGPGTTYGIEKTVAKGTVLPIKGSTVVNGTTWYYVQDRSGWGTAERADVKYYMDPANFLGDLKSSLQFADLSSSANIDVNEVNEKILKGKGILDGRAQDFVDAGRAYGVNEIYLIAHALLETGNGTSALANGVKYNNTIVYNMYGIGAVDRCPLDCGSQTAYQKGWTTPSKAIIGGAAFIGTGYVNAGQNTLYKMRWNPDAAVRLGYASHQYATDIGWAAKQTSRMNDLYNLLDHYEISLIIPRFQ